MNGVFYVKYTGMSMVLSNKIINYNPYNMYVICWIRPLNRFVINQLTNVRYDHEPSRTPERSIFFFYHRPMEKIMGIFGPTFGTPKTNLWNSENATKTTTQSP